MIAKGFSEPTERVKRLKKAIVDAIPYVEDDRAILVTESYKQTEGLSPVMRRAKAVEHIFNNLPVTIHDDELIVGAITKNLRSTELCPEFSFDWVEAEFDTMATRMADPFVIPKDTAARLHEVFKYWKGRTTSELAKSYMSKECVDAQDAHVFTVGNYFFGGIGHVCVDYGKVIKEGFVSIIKEAAEHLAMLKVDDPEYAKKSQFYQAVIISYNAAINFAHRYADKAREMAAMCPDPVRKAELLQIAANCDHVPQYPARNFYEACQAFWFLQAMIQIEANGHSISPGRLDTFMWDAYKVDKNISKEFAQELIDCIWIKLNDVNKTRDEVSAQAFAGYAVFQNLGVGGTDEEGLDMTNDISYMCIEAAAHVQLPAPSFSIRYHVNTPDEFLFRACELARLGLGYPAMYNDEAIVPAMMNRGIPLKDARSYCIIGCVEPQVPHKTDGWHDAAFFNVAKILEITMNAGMCDGKQLGPQTKPMVDWKSMDDFYEAYQTQMEYFVDLLAEADNAVDIAHRERAPLPFMSALVEDCMGRGKTVMEGGAIYNFTGPQAFGIIDTGDSVYAMQKHVFELKDVDIRDLKEALDHNFGYQPGTKEIATRQTRTDVNKLGCCGRGMPSPLQGAAQAQNKYAQGVSTAPGEDQIKDIVKRILVQNGSIDLGALTQQVNQSLSSSSVAACTTPLPSDANAKYLEIKRRMEDSECFGNDYDPVDMVARKCTQIYEKEVEKHMNPRGGQFQAGCYPVSANVLFGKDVAAIPDGRLATDPLADGVGPRQGHDVNGPTACFNSVGKLDHESASNGTLLNYKFLPSAVAGDDGLRNFASVVRGYFDKKGMHVQFNVIDKDTLLEAQKNPEAHKDLVVRVAGYSAQFTGLAKEVQDDIIGRTENDF